jgi:hypothetical protein
MRSVNPMNMNDLPDSQLVRDALDTLDRYDLSLGKRDQSRSLNENPADLLGRIRTALAPLASEGGERAAHVAEIVRRIDEACAALPLPQRFPDRVL